MLHLFLVTLRTFCAVCQIGRDGPLQPGAQPRMGVASCPSRYDLQNVAAFPWPEPGTCTSTLALLPVSGSSCRETEHWSVISTTRCKLPG
jgi:hypothetical protein